MVAGELGLAVVDPLAHSWAERCHEILHHVGVADQSSASWMYCYTINIVAARNLEARPFVTLFTKIPHTFW